MMQRTRFRKATHPVELRSRPNRRRASIDPSVEAELQIIVDARAR